MFLSSCIVKTCNHFEKIVHSVYSLPIKNLHLKNFGFLGVQSICVFMYKSFQILAKFSSSYASLNSCGLYKSQFKKDFFLKRFRVLFMVIIVKI